MTDQRFKYYTGYEVDNEPSDDDDDDLPCNTAITNNQNHSDSSSDEFDEPIREYVEKTMSQTNSTTISTVSNAFANEMEDELDRIYQNFISRGTFELPISTQKSDEKKRIVLNKNDEKGSDDDDDDEPPVVTKEEQEKINDDLLYDPEEEEADEKWMINQRLKSQGINTTDTTNVSSLGPTDAVLNCPGCMILVCHDCQRHETNRNQYRAMFVFNCTIDENRLATVLKSSSQQKKKNNNKRFKSEELNPEKNDDKSMDNNEILRPVLCSECGTELGVYEPTEELYHFANVLASH